MIPQDQLDRIGEIIRRARAAGNAEALAKAVDLLGQALRQNAAEAAESRAEADPMTRAREADGLHKLRKGRDRCTATRRDGAPCEAPAVVGALVCRRHGGGAPQVLIAARQRELEWARYVAYCEWEESRGTPREFDARCKEGAAKRELDAYEAKLGLLAELRAELKRRRAESGTVRASPREPRGNP